MTDLQSLADLLMRLSYADMMMLAREIHFQTFMPHMTAEGVADALCRTARTLKEPQ